MAIIQNFTRQKQYRLNTGEEENSTNSNAYKGFSIESNKAKVTVNWNYYTYMTLWKIE